jgi:hypothetical protein
VYLVVVFKFLSKSPACEIRCSGSGDGRTKDLINVF